MTDLMGKDIDWTAGTRMERNRGVLATNGYLHATLVAAIASSDF
jgi:hypothetical protein